MAEKNVNIHIKSKADNKGFLSVSANLAALKRMAGGVLGGIASIGRMAMSAFRTVAVGVGAAVAAGTYLVKQYTDAEDAENNLAAAIRNRGGAVDTMLPKLKAFAMSMQAVTKHGDDEIINQMAYAINLGVSAGKAEEATKAAIGLSAAYRIDLATAMQLVGRASQGQTQMLSRYGIIIKESLSKTEKFNAVLKIGAKSFGLAEAETKTLSGSFAQFRNQTGDVFEEFGRGIVLTFDLVNVFKRATEWTRNFLNELQSSGAMDKFAANAKEKLGQVADIIKAIFAGGEQREIAVSGLADIGTDIGKKATAMMIAGAQLVGSAIWQAISKAIESPAASAGERFEAKAQAVAEQSGRGAPSITDKIAAGWLSERRLGVSDRVDEIVKERRAISDDSPALGLSGMDVLEKLDKIAEAVNGLKNLN